MKSQKQGKERSRQVWCLFDGYAVPQITLYLLRKGFTSKDKAIAYAKKLEQKKLDEAKAKKKKYDPLGVVRYFVSPLPELIPLHKEHLANAHKLLPSARRSEKLYHTGYLKLLEQLIAIEESIQDER